MKFSTAIHVMSLEFRKLITYRFIVWMRLGMMVFTQVTVGYFLWSAVFRSQNISSLHGYTLPTLISYYIVLPFVERMVRGPEMGFISNEIYDGTFTRYLLYPVSFLQYKLLSFLCISLFSFIQLTLIVTVLVLAVGTPEGIHLSAFSVVGATLMLMGSIYLYYIMNVIVELLSLWVDNVWSLNIMLRMAMRFLGGSLFPLTFFPAAFLATIKWTPFPYLLGMPVQMFFGQLSRDTYFSSVAIMTLWAVFLTLSAHIIFKRGTRQYTGVGV